MEWRAIPGYPGYEASNTGRIRSNRKILAESHGCVNIKGHGQRSARRLCRLAGFKVKYRYRKPLDRKDDE